MRTSASRISADFASSDFGWMLRRFSYTLAASAYLPSSSRSAPIVSIASGTQRAPGAWSTQASYARRTSTVLAKRTKQTSLPSDFMRFATW